MPNTRTSSQTPSGRDELAAILEVAARSDGPVRLLQPRELHLREAHPGLFPSSKGRHGDLQRQLVGSMLEETLARPRMVKLTKSGIETLLRNTSQADRPKLIAGSSPLYQEAMLNAWKKVATRGEQPDLEQSATQCFGQWLSPDQHLAVNTGQSLAKSELDEFRELFVQEVAGSWQESESEEARSRLAHLLRLLGAKPLGTENEIVEFTGMTHHPLQPLFKGDSAKVIRPGWTFPTSTPPLLLAKAMVEPTN